MEKVIRVEFKNGIDVKVEGAEQMSQKELLEIVKKKVIQKLSEGFPAINYSINDTDTLSFSNVSVGMMIDADKNGYGIITKINKKTINVATSGGKLFQGPPSAFKLIEEGTEIKDVLWERDVGYKQSESWKEGDTGYLIVKEDIHPVVLVNSRNDRFNAVVIGEDRRFGPIDTKQLNALMYDTLEEAENKTRKDVFKGKLTLKQ